MPSGNKLIPGFRPAPVGLPPARQLLSYKHTSHCAPRAVVFLWLSTGLIGLPFRALVILRFTGSRIFCGKTSVCNATDQEWTKGMHNPH